jgi:predicted metal-dependent phosphoesterase TrpH
LESYKQIEIELKKQIQTQKQEIYSLKEQNAKVVTKFNNKLQTFAETIESLEEQLQTLKVKSEAQQVPNSFSSNENRE